MVTDEIDGSAFDKLLSRLKEKEISNEFLNFLVLN